MTQTEHRALTATIRLIAADIGRLRRELICTLLNRRAGRCVGLRNSRLPAAPGVLLLAESSDKIRPAKVHGWRRIGY